MASTRATEREYDLVDLGSEESFPASDPPSYMGGTAVAGGPPDPSIKRPPVSTELIDPVQARPDPPPRSVVGARDP